MFDLKTSVLIWGLFMSATMESAIHLETFFHISLRLIAEN